MSTRASVYYEDDGIHVFQDLADSGSDQFVAEVFRRPDHAYPAARPTAKPHHPRRTRRRNDPGEGGKAAYRPRRWPADRQAPGKEARMTYSLCETVTATGSSRRHIRQLTAKGQKLSGGADTIALCGRAVAWDLGTPIAKITPEAICPGCLAAYAALGRPV